MPSSSADPIFPDTDRLTPHVVFFGPPYSGKSSLIRAFLTTAMPPGRDAEVFARNDPPGGLQRELVPHLIRFADSSEPSGTVVVCDCDGRAASELLSHPSLLIRGASRGALAGAVRSADALVLVVDAAATPEEVDATFRAFGEFLDGLEEGRAFGREVGGLSVFLTLTKCDALYREGDDPTDWLGRIEARKLELEARFQDYFGDDIADSDVSPYLPFGSIDLHLAATATHTPDPPAFKTYADTDGSFGVADLVEDVLPAARVYRTRLLRGRQRLRVTVAGAGGLVGMMALGVFVLVAVGWSVPDPLMARVLAYRTSEGPPTMRLSDRNLARNRRELLAVREAPRFDWLPSDVRDFVNDRLKEFEAYRGYRAKFQPPRIGPADVRSREELKQLETALAVELLPPSEYAAVWSVTGAETEAVRLSAKWKADTTLLGEAEEQVYDWYRGLVRRANQLMLVEEPPDGDWRGRVGLVVAAENDPPFRPADKVPGSPTVPVRGGTPLTYAPAFEFDRIDQARNDWNDTRDRLLSLRDLCDAVGLTAGPGTPSAVLDLPEPGVGVDSLNLASARLNALAGTFPNQPTGFSKWSLDNFPDPARRWLEPRLRAAFDAGVRHVRGLILAQLGQDRPEDWRRLADGFLTEPPVRDWGTLLGLSRRWTTPDSPESDPVRELATFLKTERFDLKLDALDMSIPDDLLGDRLIPAGKLVVRYVPVGGSPVDLMFRPEGEGRRERPATVYHFVPEGSAAITYRPRDAMSVALPARVGGREYRLVWNSPRSAVYHFDALAQPPVLEKVGPVPAPELVPGMRVTAMPDGGLPVVPVLVPAVRPATP